MFLAQFFRATLSTLFLVFLPLWSVSALAAANTSKFQTIEWDVLLPQADLEAFMSPPEYLDEIEDGSEADQVGGELSSNAQGLDDEWHRALVSVNVVEEMNQKPVRVPGFIVPLEYDEDQRVIEFFLVPYFGACIHVPPPPPNQIIYMRAEEGVELVNIYEPVWVSGLLETSLTENQMATSAYSMNVELIEPYELE